MSLVLQSSGGGSVTLQEPVTASNLTITVPAVTGTMLTTASAGTVLQVVSATYSVATEISSTAFVDSGLSASIIPSSSTSKILVLTTQSGYVGRDNSLGMVYSVNLVRGSTEISLNAYRFRGGLATDARLWAALHTGFTYLDSPNTTSSITYKTQAKTDTTANAATIRFNTDSGISSITLMEISA
jgi:hypothetical protein